MWTKKQQTREKRNCRLRKYQARKPSGFPRLAHNVGTRPPKQSLAKIKWLEKCSIKCNISEVENKKSHINNKNVG